MIIPYAPWHLDLMREAGIIGAVYPDALERLGPLNLAYTIVAWDEPKQRTVILGVAGAAPMLGREKTAEVFVVAANARDEYPFVFARSVRHILEYSSLLFGRIEAACPMDDARRRRFIEWLGFDPIPGSAVSGSMMRWAMEGTT